MRNGPIDVVLAVTYRCNARCIMCSIWKHPSTDDLRPEEYRFLPDSLRYVNLSGGEPFLRDDLPEIVRVVKERVPRAKTIISTNGFLTGRIAERMPEILKADPSIGVGISIDGMGATHDRVRGIPGGFDKCMNTLETLKSLGMTNLRLAFTVVRENVEELGAVYALTKKLGIQFTLAVAQDSPHYFRADEDHSVHADKLREHLGPLAEDLLRSAGPKNWLRAFFAHGLFRYAAGAGRPFVCNAGSDFFFVGPNGNIYPCNILDDVMGNVRESSFDEIWNSERAETIRRKVRACDLRCWMICTARADMKRNAPRVLSWIARNKAAAHAGRFHLRLPEGEKG
ncbi:MAG: radical SAM protein [Candidatus Eisenbacteria bacterium]|nr:radical SAM protein [Candidatus Eisenbacteria bacterium]